MVLIREYRICMPLSVEEYKIGQLYTISRHSLEQTASGSGVEIIANHECEDPKYGKGQFTEKRIHLSGRLPYWLQAVLPRIFYVTEKAWNYYPYTVTEYTCSFIPKFSVSVNTAFEDNFGTNENCLNLSDNVLRERSVDYIDIVYDEVSPKRYKEEEDLRFYQSKKTGRGPFVEGWQQNVNPVMCSYKVVQASFEVWGLQTKVEELIQSSIREILLIAHRQAVAWLDEWLGMSLDDVREYERQIHSETNDLVKSDGAELARSPGPATPGRLTPPTPLSPSATPTSGSWFSWS